MQTILNPLDGFFPALLRASWQAGALVLVVLAAQRLLAGRLPPRWRHALWLIVLARLLLPVSVPSPASVFNFLHMPATPSVRTEGLPPPSAPVFVPGDRGAAAQPDFSAAPAVDLSPPLASGANPPSVGLAESASTAAPTSAAPIGWRRLAAWLWLAGVVGFTTVLAVQTLGLARRLRQAVPITEEPWLRLLEACRAEMGVRRPVGLCETAAVHSPALCGVFRPRLLLPRGLTGRLSSTELRHVLLHELAHLKRHDLALNWLATTLQVLHWFNPLVWLAHARMRADRELACDALALEAAGEAEKEAYGETILRLLEGFTHTARLPGLVGILEDRRQLRRRILAIAGFRKPSRRSALAAVLVAGLAIVGLTDAQSPEPTKAESRPPVQAAQRNSESEGKPDPEATKAQVGAPTEAGQYVDLSAEIRLTQWWTRGAKTSPWSVRCVVGLDRWEMDGEFLQRAKSACWFNGNAIIQQDLIECSTVGLGLVDWTDGPPGEQRRCVQARIPIGLRQVSTFESKCGNPGRPGGKPDALTVDGSIAWLAFCSGPCLKLEGRRLYPPSCLWKPLISAPDGFSDRTTVFEDGLGLPKNLNLYTAKGQPILQYRVLESTNVGGWNFPLQFKLVQYRPPIDPGSDGYGTNAWELAIAAEGRLTAIHIGKRPEVPIEVMDLLDNKTTGPAAESTSPSKQPKTSDMAPPVAPKTGAEAEATLPALHTALGPKDGHVNAAGENSDDRLWGTVFLDSQPLPGASVSYFDGKSRIGGSTPTDQDGRIFVYPNPAAKELIVSYEGLQAALDAQTLTNEFRVDLRSLPGGIEGRLWWGDKPWPETTLNLRRRWPAQIEPAYGAVNRTNRTFELSATTDAEGRFAFSNVPAGDWVIRGGRIQWGSVEVKPGEVSRLDLGREGVVITGHAVTEPPDRAVNWPAAWVSLHNDLNKPDVRIYPGEAENDGSFIVSGVVPGDYQLFIAPKGFPAAGPSLFPVSLGSSGPVSVVVPTNSTATNRVIDLGAVTVKMGKQLKIGDLAPPFEVKTFDGQTVRLADFKGKVVLLCFWWAGTYSGDRQWLKQLLPLRQQYRQDDRLVILGVNLNQDAAEAEAVIAEEKWDWLQTRAADRAAFFRDEYELQSTPALVVIGADGRVRARSYYVDGIRSALWAAVGGQRSLNPQGSILRCQVDGLSMEFTNMVKAVYTPKDGLEILGIGGDRWISSHLSLRIPVLRTGRFTLEGTPSLVLDYSKNIYSSDSASGYAARADSAGTSLEVNITEVGAVGERVTGTFSGVVTNDRGEKLTLTDGYFSAIREASISASDTPAPRR